MGLEGIFVLLGALLALGIVVWGSVTKRHSLGIAVIALIVAIVSAGCGVYAFAESQSLPWAFGYGIAFLLASAVGAKHIIGKRKQDQSV